MAGKAISRDREALADMEDGLVTVKEACQFLRLGVTKVYDLMNRGELSYVKFGRARRIPRRVLVEFVAQHLRGGWQQRG